MSATSSNAGLTTSPWDLMPDSACSQRAYMEALLSCSRRAQKALVEGNGHRPISEGATRQ